MANSLTLPALVAPIFLSITQSITANIVTNNPASVSNKTYDYIIVAGGLTGLIVAARLAEVFANTVVVIGAGRDDRSDSRIYDIFKPADLMFRALYLVLHFAGIF